MDRAYSNILTNTMERLSKMLIATSKKIAQQNPDPYGMYRLTPAEQKAVFESMDENDMMMMLEEKGVDATNAYINAMTGGKNGR